MVTTMGLPQLPQLPSEAELATQLQLTAPQAQYLFEALRKVIATITTHAASVKREPDRKTRIRVLRLTVARFNDLKRMLCKPKGVLRSIVDREILPSLGLALTTASLERAVESQVAWGVSGRPVDEVIQRLSDPVRGTDLGTLERALDHLTQNVRPSVAVQIGPKLITYLIEILKNPVEENLKIEGSQKGGRPALLYRNYLIQELVPLFENIHERPATATKRGPFAKFCSCVLEATGMDSTGVDGAVARVLKRMARA